MKGGAVECRTGAGVFIGAKETARESTGAWEMKGVPYVSKRLKKKGMTYPVNALGLASVAAEATMSSRMRAADVLLWRCVVR